MTETNPDIRYQTAVTPEDDARYMELAKEPEKNEAELSRMVAAAAKRAFSKSKVKSRNGNLRLIFHGTESDFTEFDPRKFGGKTGIEKGYGIYLTTRKTLAEHYGDRVIEGYANITRPARSWDQAISPQELQKLIRDLCERDAEIMLSDGYDTVEEALRDTWVSNYVTTYDYDSMDDVYRAVVYKILGDNDNDADVIGEIMNADGLAYSYEAAMDFYEEVLTPSLGIDGFDFLDGEDHVYLAFTSNQIKSADPVTYDDDGNVIPLSERFNEEKSDIRYQLTSVPSADDIQNNYRLVAEMDSVIDLSGDEFKKGSVDLVTQVARYFESIGGKVETPYGEILLTRRGAKSSISHGIGRNKASAFLAVPEVLKSGKIVDYQRNWKGREYDTAVIAAPIRIGKTPFYLACVISIDDESNRYYLHEVAIQQKEDSAPFKTGITSKGATGDAESPLMSLLQKLQSVKQKSEGTGTARTQTASTESARTILADALMTAASTQVCHPERSRF